MLVMSWWRKEAEPDAECFSQCYPGIWAPERLTYSINPSSWYMCNHFIIFLHVLVVMPPLQWRHNGHDSVSNHQPHDCLLNRVFRRRSKKTSKLFVIGLCAGNSPETGEFPAQMASNAENVSIWWRNHADKLKHNLIWGRVCNTKGRSHGNIGLDLVNEHLNLDFKGKRCLVWLWHII